MNEVNTPLLRKAVEWVEEQDQRLVDREWYQLDWFSRDPEAAHLRIDSEEDIHFCDTAYCVAGKIVRDAGWKPVWQGESSYTGVIIKDGVERSAQDVAAELLGIVEGEARHELFRATNSAATIRRVAEDIAGERL